MERRENCFDNGICKTFNALVLNVFPYAMYNLEYVVNYHFCKKDCLDINKTFISTDSLSGVDSDARNSADFIYPLRGFVQDEDYDEFKFLPFNRHPEFVYITQVKQTTFQVAIQSCLNLYPLFMICIMMAIIFGFIAWILESRYKESEFTKFFPIGWLKGTWWSFVTMTTQGPETTPKSIILRFLTIPWLIIAIVLIGLLTGTITSAMVKPLPTPKMEGNKVGTLQNNSYNELAILRHGGVARTIKANSTIEEIDGLYELLLSGKVNGLLFDEYAFRYYSSRYFKKNRLITTYINSIEPDLFYGILVRNKTLFDILKYFFKRDHLKSEVSLLRLLDRYYLSENKDIKEKFVGPLSFTINDRYILTGVKVLGSIIGSFFILGLFYELLRKKMSIANSGSNEAVENQGHIETESQI